MIDSDSFQQKVFQICEGYKNHTFLLAVSGGVDSMVLAHLYLIQNIDFQIAHINYKLRGKDSDTDQNLVENFCKKNKIKFHLYSVSEKDQKPEGSIQLWARDLRYRFFNEIIKKENLDYLVTAHHLNDNLETFLINLSRGSGINGLSGIPKSANRILRPLLSFSKAEIYDFANENKIEFREDVSNKKNDYLRNKIRNEIVPLLEKTNSDFLKHFDTSISYLNETKNFVEAQIAEIEKRLKKIKENTIYFDKEKLKSESLFIQFEILKKYGFDNKSELVKIFQSQTGSIFHSAEFDLLINRNEIIIQQKSDKKNTSENKVILINKPIDNIINLNNYIALPDFDYPEKFIWNYTKSAINFPIKLRHYREGDSFFPVGMLGTKKISKFFKDKKISIFAKQKIWLLTDNEDKILGIIPYRQDRRFASANDDEDVISIIYQTKKK